MVPTVGRCDCQSVSGVRGGRHMARARYIANEFSVASRWAPVPGSGDGDKDVTRWQRYRLFGERMRRSDLRARCCTDLTAPSLFPRTCDTVALSKPSMNLSTMTCR